MSQYPATIDLTALTSTTGFQLNGQAATDLAGQSVASLGDINGDGRADYIIGASGNNAGLTDNGAAYVVFGTSSGFADINLSALNGTNGFKISGEVAGDGAGISVAGAGDFNNDGFRDIVIGATGLDVTGANSGGAYIIFGKSTAFAANVALTSLTSSTGFQVNGEAAGNLAGLSVHSAGKLNNDAFDDFVVGGANGTAYVVFGKNTGIADINLSSLNGTTGFKVTGGAGDMKVASAGDVNGDGRGDIIIGSASQNAAYVIFGSASGFSSTIALSSLNGTNGFKLNGVSSTDGFGGSVSTAGDINGDGFSDIIIGAAGHDHFTASSDRGAAYVVLGKGTAFNASINVSGFIGSNGGFKIVGEMQNDVTGDGAGYSVGTAGDVNGDGLSDMIVSARGHDRGETTNPNYGASYVIFGSTGGFSSSLLLSGLTGTGGFQINGEVAGDRLGSSVSSAGDINNDGFADLLIGSETGNGGTGAAYVLLGRAPTLSINRTGTDIGQTIATGIGGDFLYGKGGHDRLLSYSGNDSLDGGLGNDTMVGGADNDTYVVDVSTDVVTEAADGGTDTVSSSTISLSLTNYTNVENLSLTGALHLSLYGNSSRNILVGNDGNNTLSGGGNNDTMKGGKGNDIYLSDGGDSIEEYTGGGTDRVDSSVTVVELWSQVENLRLTGTANINANGNSLVNTIEGNAGNNILDGGIDTLVDTLIGGGGNDTYVLRNGTDNIIDSGGVNDTVTSTITRSLAGYASVDKLILIGGDMNGTGNALNNTLIGTVGKNILDGGTGNDRLEGAGGNDTYIVDSGDTVIELANAGKDTVQSATTVTALANNVENLTLTGSNAVNATGNSLANVIVGNSGNNLINGLGGTDTMTGGLGQDTFFFNTALNLSTNLDRITDFVAADDTIRLENTGTGLFNALALGTLSAAAFKANATGVATEADDRIIYNTANGNLYYDTNGSNAGGSQLFAVLTTKPTITNADFVIV
ncbi:MAG: hypothetical protein NW216_06195 [Hyphomicrobium sp.]|nr:hypothetical protein [Hyphomicrobium sp.]